MRLLLTALLSATLAQALAASVPGIAFLTDLDDARAAARRTGRPIFLDAYTTWCAPCKQMEAEVFTDPALAELVNTQYIPLRLDMEAEPGARLATQHNVYQYPTLLILDGAGEELHRAVGYLDIPAATAFAKTGLDPAARWRTLDRRFRRGDRDTALLATLTAYAKTAALPQRADYALALLQARGDWDDPAAQTLLLESVQRADDALFPELVRRREALSLRFGAPLVDERIGNLVEARLYGDNALRRRRAKRLLARAYPQAVDSTYGRYQMRLAREAGKAKRFGRLAIKQQVRYPTDDPDELAELAYIFDAKLPGYRTATVLGWAERVLEERPYDEGTREIAERLRGRL